LYATGVVCISAVRRRRRVGQLKKKKKKKAQQNKTIEVSSLLFTIAHMGSSP
jgi:hypothetical protein